MNSTVVPHLGWLSFGGYPLGVKLTANIAVVPVQGYITSASSSSYMFYTIDVDGFAFRGWSPTRSSPAAAPIQAFFDAGSSPARAAEGLRVHVNTVTQRLERVARLLGKEWSTPERALEVQLALRLHRLTDAVRR